MIHAPAHLLLAIAIRTAVVLLVLVGGLRLFGKRQIGQMNLFDLVLVMALANAVQNAMTMGRGELLVGIVSAGTLLLAGRLLTTLFLRRPQLHERLVGTPTVIIDHGRLQRDAMRREHLTEDEVMAALREHGVCDPSDARLVVLEVDGSLSVVPREHGS
jgi:uncharacterized membrane protein YcaP (DUF421 family)